ncbi:hypothetical protein [Pedobacter frigidisoli]|uniref:hypothetical protein n=1 Tax=Pedobacter frigidisoli TaxID=2530455 RepID=UPI00292D26F0|nr:hypothetical protein [Pedobacter frigidisoli]
MINILTQRTVAIGRLLLMIWLVNVLLPIAGHALTTGPSQPEVQQFQPVGLSDMVDLNSGDFKYNIPLLDIDGYPVNLIYQSGTGMEDEASWVGLGWNLNVGAINRQVRGVADDFGGEDKVETSHHIKKKITIGGRLHTKMEIRGRFQETNSKSKLGITGNLSLGVFNDNYTGYGAEISANAGISFSFVNSGRYTGGLGLGVTSSTANGADISPNISLAVREGAYGDSNTLSNLSSSLGYNSRSGMKALSFGQTYKGYSGAEASHSFNTEPIMPKVQIPYRSTFTSVTFDAGLSATVLYWGAGATGYINTREVANENMSNPAYGFLYAERGKDNPDALMDFIREKDNPVIKDMPNLALPVTTPDVWTYNSQAGSGQFRLYRGGTGAYFDNRVNEQSKAESYGVDLGFGLGKHIGVNAYNQFGNNTTQKWTDQNAYIKKGDFQDEPRTDPRYQHVFFKAFGELSQEDETLAGRLKQSNPVSIKIGGSGAANEFVVQNGFYNNLNQSVNDPILKTQRQVQKTAISYLTAKEASIGGLNKTIDVYPFYNYGSFVPPEEPDLIQPIEKLPRVSGTGGTRKNHHISEITVNESGGQRAVYGFPVYNISHEEYSFAVGKNVGRQAGGYLSDRGLVAVSASGVETGKGIDHYYHKEKQPAYAYAYMLSGILSPDYQDKTGDGITPDDNGSALKFNYSKINNFKWRTPYNNHFSNASDVKNLANLNRGLLADPDDDKGSIVYGEKEIAYVNSIVSRTKVAYFITEDRKDGLGVNGLNGERGTVRQKRLREIRLYSRMDMSKPIKVIKFDYDYGLCPNTPNSDATASDGAVQGKLTLKAVWFEYGKTTKGANHKYKFGYNAKINNQEKGYVAMSMDRWGTFKDGLGNIGGLSNEEFPYSDQNKALADDAAALWNLSSIILPSGGEIKVDYEADDYAYVQNRQAMVMAPFSMAGSADGSLNDEATGININLPSGRESGSQGTDLQWFKENYLNGSSYIYTKTFVKVGTEADDYDLVPVYCKIQNVSINGNTANVTFEQIQEAGLSINPIRHAAWQRLKNEYPRYAYPGFQNRVGDNVSSGAKAVFAAIGNAVGNLAELKENFYQKAKRKGLATQIRTGQSFAKIAQRSGFKIGGGVRVKRLFINDNWGGFSGTGIANGVFGQAYDYTMLEGGKRISSGVAAYEPGIGSDENPFRQPVPYMQKIKGAINNYFELEEPFGESFFPAPSVGYSKVTVRDLDANGIAQEWPKTGLTIHEFYTARDFPTKVTVTPIKSENPIPAQIYAVVTTNYFETLTMSQGYCIEVNDMHGRPKATRVFNASGAEISSTEYQYRVKNANDRVKELNNQVTIVDQSGTLHSDKIIGRDIELFTDLREQKSSNAGVSATIGIDFLPVFQIPIPHIPINVNTELKIFRSACAVKVVSTTGILYKVIKKQDGASSTVENMAYDGLTGDAVITKTQSEFKQDFYTLNLPAYWPYSKMGGAYKTVGMVLKDVALNNFKEINQQYWDILSEGDELINTSSGDRYWVINCRPLELNPVQVFENGLNEHTGYTKGLIDRSGKKLAGITQSQNTFKVVRSVYRNQLEEVAASVVSLKYPVYNNRIILATEQELGSYKVLSASAKTYDQLWPGDSCGQSDVPIENQSMIFRFKDATNHSLHGQAPARIFNACDDEVYIPNCGNPFVIPNNTFMNRRLWTAGIWLAENNDIYTNINRWVGVRTAFKTEYNKTYYIGFSGDDDIRITIDGSVISTDRQSLEYWTMRPLNIPAGQHTIEIEGYNTNRANNSDAENPGSFGVEIYNNTANELVAANSAANLNIIFTTHDLVGRNDLQSFRSDVYGNRVWHFTNDSYYNPFVQGLLGNWRPQQQFTYQVSRRYSDIFGQAKGADLKNAGTFENFASFFSYSNERWNLADAGAKWTNTSRVTAYDRYGQELETRDAMDKSSAALFDFNGLLPSAVASNAMNREIYFNSFEDTQYRLKYSGACMPVGFDIMQGKSSLNSVLTSRVAHSGINSVLLTGNGIKLTTSIHNVQPKTNFYLNYNNGQYTLNKGIGMFNNGFEPVPNKTYIISFWIKDGRPDLKTLQLFGTRKTQNSGASSLSFNYRATVEGWKLVEAELPIYNTLNETLEITIGSNGGNITHIDDIRIKPKQSQMKSYIYHPGTFKLMAEMDENGFSTLYEYDDEGSLIRVKKETERGIVTLKETRSALRRQL